jgi:glycosyltransferase involved in cell wall biosynthesis
MVATAAGLLKLGWDVRIMALGSLSSGDCVGDEILTGIAPTVEDDILRLGITPEFGSAFEKAKEGSFVSSGPALGAEAFGLPPSFIKRLGPVRTAIEHYRPTVVHGWLDVPAIVAALAACELGVPRVVVGQRTCWDYMRLLRYSPEIVDGLWHVYRRVSANPAVTILNNSAAGAASYERWLRLRPGTIRVLKNGYMPGSVEKPAADAVAGFRTKLGWRIDTPVVGCVMRFEKEKDPDLWIDTAAEIAKLKPDAHFLLLGYGTMHDAIVRSSEALGLGDRIFFLPAQVSDVGLLYAVADVVLLTSLSEGVPNVLIEAQAAGRPVVASNFPSASEAILHGRTGCIVAERSARCLAEVTTAILDDPAWHDRARTEGPAFVASRFDFERMLRETIELYELSQTKPI